MVGKRQKSILYGRKLVFSKINVIKVLKFEKMCVNIVIYYGV